MRISGWPGCRSSVVRRALVAHARCPGFDCMIPSDCQIFTLFSFHNSNYTCTGYICHFHIKQMDHIFSSNNPSLVIGCIYAPFMFELCIIQVVQLHSKHVDIEITLCFVLLRLIYLSVEQLCRSFLNFLLFLNAVNLCNESLRVSNLCFTITTRDIQSIGVVSFFVLWDMC